MSITAYEYLSVLQATETARGRDGGFDYPKLLENVRSLIAARHSAELSSALGSADAAQTLKTLILKYCTETLAGQEFDRAALVERIYQDMAGLEQYVLDGIHLIQRKSVSVECGDGINKTLDCRTLAIQCF